ncbi:hypothetical protein IQ247_17530 [Plectonema cf. radiosum LEGE 06105]|uniref:Uncharacterized protein n=1 Tax=Plectonema cf. radiosum LEGE 06105 TaxID=945769 RepID=A0A8J7F1L9_9CYAN|nr:hypothetical protein [Plectonema radiosum]MBE9214446.1 hypothetical protein [Plectonema cf. radiosum LEGE 06105]
MPSLFKRIPLNSSESNIKEQRLLLIPRSQRQEFFLLFTFMTTLGWIGGGIASLALEKILRENIPADFAQNELLWYRIAKLIATSLFALIFAADQSIPLHKYISGWWWTFATAIGWLVANTVSNAWIAYISSVAASTNQISSQTVIFLGILSNAAYIFSWLWLGLLQYLVLRKYVKTGWWWIFVPSISYLFISISMLLVSWGENLIPVIHRHVILYLIKQGLTAFILAAIPAISFCRLHRKNI